MGGRVKVSEKRFRTILGSKRRIVIPEQIAALVNAEPGDWVEGQVYGANKVLLTFLK